MTRNLVIVGWGCASIRVLARWVHVRERRLSKLFKVGDIVKVIEIPDVLSPGKRRWAEAFLGYTGRIIKIVNIKGLKLSEEIRKMQGYTDGIDIYYRVEFLDKNRQTFVAPFDFSEDHLELYKIEDIKFEKLKMLIGGHPGAEAFNLVLEPNEEPLDICPAHDLNRDLGGTLLVTDRRLLFVDAWGRPQSLLALPYEKILSMEAPGGGLIMKELILKMEGAELRFGVGRQARQSITDVIRRFKKN